MAEAKTPAQKATTKTTTTKKPAAKPVTTKPAATTAKPAAVKKPAAAKKPAVKKTAAPGAEERYRMIEVAAYYIAERNGFSGDNAAYWAEAEIQIANQLTS